MKFTFKTEKPTGTYRSFYPSAHYIKLKGKQVGSITDKEHYKIRLKVVKKDVLEDGDPNCTWKWITLTKESQSLQEAKDFLNENIDSILTKYNLHFID